MPLLSIIERIAALLGKIGASRTDARMREIDAAATEARKERMRKIDDEITTQKRLEDATEKQRIEKERVMDRIDRADTIAGIDEAMRGRR